MYFRNVCYVVDVVLKGVVSSIKDKDIQERWEW